MPRPGGWRAGAAVALDAARLRARRRGRGGCGEEGGRTRAGGAGQPGPARGLRGRGRPAGRAVRPRDGDRRRSGGRRRPAAGVDLGRALDRRPQGFGEVLQGGGGLRDLAGGGREAGRLDLRLGRASPGPRRAHALREGPAPVAALRGGGGSEARALAGGRVRRPGAAQAGREGAAVRGDLRPRGRGLHPGAAPRAAGRGPREDARARQRAARPPRPPRRPPLRPSRRLCRRLRTRRRPAEGRAGGRGPGRPRPAGADHRHAVRRPRCGDGRRGSSTLRQRLDRPAGMGTLLGRRGRGPIPPAGSGRPGGACLRYGARPFRLPTVPAAAATTRDTGHLPARAEATAPGRPAPGYRPSAPAPRGGVSAPAPSTRSAPAPSVRPSAPAAPRPAPAAPRPARRTP